MIRALFYVMKYHFESLEFDRPQGSVFYSCTTMSSGVEHVSLMPPLKLCPCPETAKRHGPVTPCLSLVA